jgi:hypothetical protein
MSGRQVGDELAQPLLWVLQAGGEVVHGDEGPVGVALPAGIVAAACGATRGGVAGRSTGVVSTSNRSFGLQPNAVHNASRVDGFTCAGPW